MKRGLLALALSLALVLVGAAACTPQPTPTAIAAAPTSAPLTPTPVPPTATPVPATATPAAFPLTITDSLDRQITLKELPQRVVSLAPSLTEILFAVGAGDQVVGVTEYCNYPAEAESREQVGAFSAKTISVEKIVALKPGLVLASGPIHEPVIEALENVGVVVVSVDPATLDEVYEDIELVGRMTGHPEAAAQTVAEMKSRIGEVVAVVETIPRAERVTVFWQIWDEPLMTAGPDTFPGQMIALAGGINIFAELSEDWPTVSVEEVLKRNPAVIVGPDTHGDKLTPEVVGGRPGWDQIDAVRNKRIHLIDGDIVSRPGPRLADALIAVAQALYPDRFK